MMTEGKDFIGNTMRVGDEVVFNPPSYKGLVKGVLLKFTPKGYTVGYTKHGRQHQDTTNVGEVMKGQKINGEIR